jgi:hypothetical protein
LKVEKQYKDRVEATIAGARSIADCCVKSQTVKRLIYTATVLASSPLNEDGSGYKSCMDESCWTPSDLSLTYANDYVLVFLLSYPELPHRMTLVLSFFLYSLKGHGMVGDSFYFRRNIRIQKN